MFILAYKMDDKTLNKLLDYIDFGMGPNFDYLEGERATGFIIKQGYGYLFVKGGY